MINNENLIFEEEETPTSGISDDEEQRRELNRFQEGYDGYTN